MSNELFEQVVTASRLNRLVAPFTIRRLLIRSDVSPDALTHDGLRRALPRIEEGIAVYLKGDEYERAVRALRELAEAQPAHHGGG